MLHINVIEAPDHAKAVEMLANGEADGFVMDDVLLYGLVSAGPMRASSTSSASS